MSVVICDKCTAAIDSDFDVECFIQDYDEVLCKSCRDNRDERAYDRQQQSLMDGDHLETKQKLDQQLRQIGRGHLCR
jgi:hypothetical protein